ncbi:ATP-binding cassette domain-containing protein [Rubrobacter tropicus]|uniref:ATP-binding cassette domain-containing protein n=1 Tax=Rubrobacter tropicus TaxID=2653851 RepID=A0A6G8QDA6_9ACTN|nr:ABC transporter ATP-binding protein [Rubrobacter tropicus]QIN84381.1 ATP-binding cassette domain-containing protein [Rubrobacter tropicus]
MISKVPARLLERWRENAPRAYVTTLLEMMSWRVALALALMLFRSASQAAQLLLLIPLMQLVGLDVQKGPLGWLSGAIRSAFGMVGLQTTPAAVLGAFVLLTTAVALVSRWQSTSNFWLQQEFVARLRRRLYSSIADADWLTFSRSRSSDFTHALTTELDRVGAATAYLLQLLTGLVLVPVYVVLAVKISVSMTGLVFLCGAALLLLLRKKTRASRRIGEEMSQATSDLYSAAIEHLGAMKTVKSYGAEVRSASIFSALTERTMGTYLAGNRNYADAAFWFSVGSASILSAILLVSLELLELPAASLLFLLVLFNRMIPLFGGIQGSLQSFMGAVPAFARTADMRRRLRAAAEARPDAPAAVELRDALKLEGVCFGYEDGRRTLRDLDLTVEAGSTAALVGPSGAGKSTVADLVSGLLAPTEGAVLVDGRPLVGGARGSWRDRIGYVAQETFLFNDTVRSNLLWARPDANEEELVGALDQAAARKFVAGLPDGLETRLGDRGVRLSGGERQRLALARALLRRPSLLILDEATSALDSENERRVLDAVEGLRGRLTILLITHRLSAARFADVVHVLENGELVESGEPDALLAGDGGRFAAFCEAQGIRAPGSLDALRRPPV